MAEALCPVCDAGLLPGAPACGTCGFPVALREEAIRGIREGNATATPVPTGPRHPEPFASRPVAARPGPDPVEPLAVDLAQTLAHIKKEGADVAEFLDDLKQAAFEQIEGHPTEAVAIVRRASKKIGAEAQRRAEARVAEIETRRAALAHEGIQDGLSTSWERARSSLESGRYAEADELLGQVDRESLRIEQEFQQLRGSLTSLEELAEVGSSLPVPAATNERIQKVRGFPSTPPHSVEALTQAKRSAAELAEALRQEITRHLSEELSENAEALSEFPVHYPPAQQLRQMHSEAAVRLREGRVVEASRLVAELRRSTSALAPYKESPEPPPAPARSRAEGTSAESRGGLTASAVIATARTLAARVRSLPAGSAIATRAAPEIRRATELLKHRKLEEAHEVLTRLMTTLDAESPSPPDRRSR